MKFAGIIREYDNCTEKNKEKVMIDTDKKQKYQSN